MIKKTKNTKKNKKQVIVVPSASAESRTKLKKTKSALAKPRSVRAKENTLAYYNCLIDKVVNSPAKITQLSRDCKCNKGEIAQAQAKHKQQLVKEVAKNYKAFGQSLGHYLQADIIGCLEKK